MKQNEKVKTGRLDSGSGLPMDNPLATAPITGLVMKYAIPAIVTSLVSAVYNITDQIFIGQIVGMLGNAATNVAFPLTTFISAFALMLSLGTASNFNLNMGAGKKDEAAKYAGTGIAMMAILGTLISILGFIFINPLLSLFGATEQVMPMAREYLQIVIIGMPFLLFSTAGANLIRADGSPTFAMIASTSGAILNIGLDALFMLVFDWGIAGAAWATVIGQVVSFAITLFYLLTKFKTVKLTKAVLVPKLPYMQGIVKLGAAGFLNHFVMMLVQITMNNTLGYYGALTPYGSEIPLAVVGVISKVNVVVLAFIIGIAQGTQPIFSYNYGAKNFARVREAYKKSVTGILCVSVLFFLCFQFFPRQIVSIFGSGEELYFQFAIRYMRIFMLMMFINGIQPLTSNFFTVTGRAKQGIFLSLTRQGLFLLPLLLILPRFFGIDGAVYAGPIADTLAVLVSISFMRREMKRLSSLDQK